MGKVLSASHSLPLAHIHFKSQTTLHQFLIIPVISKTLSKPTDHLAKGAHTSCDYRTIKYIISLLMGTVAAVIPSKNGYSFFLWREQSISSYQGLA